MESRGERTAALRDWGQIQEMYVSQLMHGPCVRGFRLSLQVSEPIKSVEEKPTAGSWQLAVDGNKNGRTNLKGWGESRITANWANGSARIHDVHAMLVASRPAAQLQKSPE